MEIRDILCVVDHSDEAKNAFRYAANLARYHDANLFALCPVPNLPTSLYMATQFNREWLDVFVHQYESEAGRLFEDFSAIATEDGIDFVWLSEQGDTESVLEKHSRLVDLVVVSKQENENSLVGSDVSIGSQVIALSAPTIILPPKRQVLPPPKNILVAWDGSKQSAKALKESMPLLRHADAVRLIQIVDEKAESSTYFLTLDEAKQFLTRHEIEANCSEVALEAGLRETDVLFSEMTEGKFDLLVMGAYGHSRLRELVLGGMTQKVLSQLAVPVLMVH